MIQMKKKRELWKHAIRHKFARKCAACGKTGPLEVDHIFPKSRHGSDNIKNLQFLCRACNLKKGAKLFWMKTTGGD